MFYLEQKDDLFFVFILFQFQTGFRCRHRGSLLSSHDQGQNVLHRGRSLGTYSLTL